MGWFKRKRDPISDKAHALNSQIEELEAQIRRLSARPVGAGSRPPEEIEEVQDVAAVPPPSKAPKEPVFEKVSQLRLQELTARPAQYNDLGVRKFDLPAAWKRLTSQIKTPESQNPKLVDLLAAGSIQGMRPLRYERRIARRRFLILVAILILFLWGLFAVLWKS